MLCKTSQLSSVMKSLMEKLLTHLSATAMKRTPPPLFSCECTLCIHIFFVSFHSSIHSGIFYKVGLLKNFEKITGTLVPEVFFLDKVAHHQTCNFIKRKSLAQMLYCEFGEIVKSTLQNSPGKCF